MADLAHAQGKFNHNGLIYIAMAKFSLFYSTSDALNANPMSDFLPAQQIYRICACAMEII